MICFRFGLSQICVIDLWMCTKHDSVITWACPRVITSDIGSINIVNQTFQRSKDKKHDKSISNPRILCSNTWLAVCTPISRLRAYAIVYDSRAILTVRKMHRIKSGQCVRLSPHISNSMIDVTNKLPANSYGQKLVPEPPVKWYEKSGQKLDVSANCWHIE